MIQKMIEQVREFQKAFNLTNNDTPTEISQEEVKLRYDLFFEEFQEYKDAKDLIERTDAIIDMLYIACGTIVTHGWFYDRKYQLQDFSTSEEYVLNEINNSLKGYLLHEKQGWIFDIIESLFNLSYLNLISDKLPELFEEVQNSNMSKLDDNKQPIINTIDSEYYDPNKPIGKVLKSKNFFEPKLKEILFPE